VIKRLAFVLAFLFFAGGSASLWVASRPLEPGPPVQVMVERRTTMARLLERLESMRIVRSAWVTGLEMRAAGLRRMVAPGTYEVRPGMSARQLAAALDRPVRTLVTVPEGLWIARAAERLRAHGLDGDAYLRWAVRTELAEGMGVPSSAGSLEGYLFPDTYDWPVGTGAKKMVLTQLDAFRQKALPAIPSGLDVHQVVIVASLVELEAKKADERARIAGVIRNRLARGMRLELDATVLYGIQEWRVLKPGEVRRLASPYNTYLHGGLPPGPVCSPGLASIRAAASPEPHGFLYYVAKPDGSHLFARTYAEHLANVRRARQAAR
jgi:UPF0755 protein